MELENKKEFENEKEIIYDNKKIDDSNIDIKNEEIKKATPHFGEEFALIDNEIETLKGRVEVNKLADSPSYILTESGWSPEDVGTWNPKTRCATLTKGIIENMIEIKTNNVILNGEMNCSTKTTIDGKANNLEVGILAEGISKLVICNFHIKNSVIGIRLMNSNNVTIFKNTISSCTSSGIYADYTKELMIDNNSYESIPYAIYINSNCHNTTVCHNYFKNSSYSITFYNNNMNNKILDNKIVLFNSIYNRARGIQISANNFFTEINNNNILMTNNSFGNQSINYLGILVQNNFETEIKNNSIIFSNNMLNNCSINYYFYCYFYGIYCSYSYSEKTPIEGNKIIIKNNSFNSNDVELDCYFYGLYLPSHQLGDISCNLNEVSICNNLFTSVATNANYLFMNFLGIYLSSTFNGNNTSNNCIKISNNKTNLTNIYSYIYIYGINLYYALSSIISSNKIIVDSNYFDTFYTNIFGLYLDYYCSINTICNNTIDILNNKGSNIYGIYSSRYILNNLYEGNIITTSGTGLYLGDTIFNNRFNNNRILDNNIGITLNSNCKFNTFTKNNIIKSENYGININNNNSYNIFKQNNILDNGLGLNLTSNSTNNTFLCNNYINGDKKNAINLNPSNNFDGNYWSDWNGVIPYEVNGAIDCHPKTTVICIKD